MRTHAGRTFGLAALLGVAVTAAACGGSSYGNGGTSGGTPTNASSATTISASDGHLTDGSGRTLYLFEADTGTTSTCSGACATAWPPVTTDAAANADGDVKASLLGATDRSDGSTQVTYAGHPLYRYSGDKAPGDMNGAGSDAFGAEWYPVTPDGKALETGEEGDDDVGYSY